MAKKKKERINFYSTNPDVSWDSDDDEEQKTLAPKDQLLYVSIDRKQRGGKSVTLVEGFVGTEEDLKDLGKMLKSKCGVGGAAKNGEIVVQGENRDKVMDLLAKEGYGTKRKGG